MAVRGPQRSQGLPPLPLPLSLSDVSLAAASLADAALFYAAHGVRVHPLYGVRPDGACMCRAAQFCSQRGKHPRVRNWPDLATADPRVVGSWWRTWPQANIGAPVPVGNLVFDIDPQRGGHLEALGPLPATRIVRTGSGGWHIFLRLPQDFSLEYLQNRIHMPSVHGIDLRTEHNYTVLPPSRNAAGLYSWETPFDHPIADLPDALLLRIAPQAKQLKQPKLLKELKQAKPRLIDIPDKQNKPAAESTSASPEKQSATATMVPTIESGRRNTTLFQLACSLRAKGAAEATIAVAVLSENKLRCSPPLIEDEVRQIVRSSLRYPPNHHDILGDLPEYRIRSDGALMRVMERDNKRGATSDPECIVAPMPLRLTARIIDRDSGQWLLRVAWREDGVWHEHVAERETVMNASKLVGLSAVGLPVHSGNARLIMEYFARYEHVNRAYLAEEHITATLGWHEQHQVYLLGSHVIGSAPAELRFAPRGGYGAQGANSGHAGYSTNSSHSGDAQLCAGLHSRGTFEQWIQTIAQMVPYPKALFAIYGALSAPLLSALEVPTFFIDWHSRTSLGKTTTLLAAASVCGKPDGSAGLVQSWNTTHVNLERLCSVCNDVPVFLDDAKSGGATGIGALIYKAASGVGKGRGTIIGRATIDHWRTVILSTGEGKLTDATVDGGARGRVLELGGPPFVHADQAELVAAIKAGVRTHFGFALPCFVRYLQRHAGEADAWQQMHRAVRQRLAHGHSNVADRLAEYFAAVCLTATLFHQACEEAGQSLSWPVPDFNALWSDVAGTTVQADTDVRALQHILSWAQSHQESFYGRHQSAQDGNLRVPAAGWAGKWENVPEWDEIAFLPHGLTEVLQRAGFNDMGAIKRAWRERQWLRLDSEGRDPQVRWRESERTRMVVLRRNAFRVVEEEVESKYDNG